MRNPDQVAAMSCPVCQVPLAMSERQGIEIDYCPQCRGIWLDRGELDKIIERNAAPVASAPPQQAAPQPTPQQHYGHQTHYKHKKHKSWLHEIFD